ncbi:glycoside hydrolase [Meira miltonrushii]|uniref:Probable beta-glucosidase G n=1 Tax=Meira miltonrushii TaxID=1280837 RepID=A0A316VLP4_9BASI|nr:glycoside hydrolase [Meira miltonrushii]PWN38476.1 glycoside hydrolase [Meira miltonrushii]
MYTSNLVQKLFILISCSLLVQARSLLDLDFGIEFSQRENVEFSPALDLQKRQADADTGHRQGGYTTWTEAESEAKKLIGMMTLDEKVNMTVGIDQEFCTGMTGSVPRLGIPSFCLSDGPTGISVTYNVSQFASPITLAATWSPQLASQHGLALGQEFHDSGVNFIFAPVAGGPLGRSPLAGRFWESLGADEYLTGVLGSQIVKALQEDANVVACTKHFIGYEQESDRNMNTLLPQTQKPYSSDIDDFTMHQLYMWSFAETARAGTGQVMCSYNRVNGTQQCQNDASLNGLLKHELNFRGNVVSDYGAAYSNEEATNNGLDLLMPGEGQFGIYPNYRGAHGEKLKDAVNSGKVKIERIDDIVKRILTPILRFQYTSKFQNFITPKIHNAYGIVGTPVSNDLGSKVQRDHFKVIRKIGSESITMVKNERNVLPLSKAKLNEKKATIAILGSDAHGSTDRGKSCNPNNECDDILYDQGTQTDGQGSAFAYPPYIINPLDAIKSYVKANAPQVTIQSSRGKHFSISTADRASRAVDLARKADVAIVFGNARGKETEDRSNLTLREHADDLIKRVAAVNKQTIVVLHTPGPVLVEEWIDHPNVTSVLFAYYPGQESGASLTPVLFGDESPSGRLPFVIGKKLDDWLPNSISDPHLTIHPRIPFSEGILIDWKWFDAKGIKPRYPFGHGLSYASFSYSSFEVHKTFLPDKETEFTTNEAFEPHQNVQGSSLYDTVLEASVTVKNAGKMKASEVVQLYISFPKDSTGMTASHLLRGFDKKEIGAGESVKFTFSIRRKDISIWDTVHQRWRIPSGEFTFFTGPQGAADWDKKLQARVIF